MAKGSGRGLRAAPSHRDYRFLVSASAVSQTGDWLYNVALLVWVYDATGSAGWVAIVTVARLVPYVLVGPLGGVVADTFDRRRVLIASDLVRAGLMIALAAITTVDGPVALAAALACLTTTVGTAYRPSVVAMLPEIVGERDLAAANAAESVVENLSVIVGPAIGATLLALGTPTLAFAVNGATFLVSAALAAALKVRSHGSVDAPDSDDARDPWIGRLVLGFHELGRSADARVLAMFMLGTSFIYGVQTVVLVLVAGEEFGRGTDGVGVLYAALGIGGVLGAALVSRLARAARLGAVMFAFLLLASVPMAVLAATDSGGAAFGLVLLSGTGAVVLDVLTLTQLQRAVSGEVLGRVWGALDALVVLAIIAGSVIVDPMVSLFGTEAAFVGLGLVVPIGGLFGIRGLVRADRESVSLLERIGPAVAVFERLAILEDADRAVIERLALAAAVQIAPTGADVVMQGEPAQDFYVIESGRFEVLVHGDESAPEPVNELAAGDWFGELGLLNDAPRAATVRAVAPSQVWRIDGSEFLEAVNVAPTMAAKLLEGVARSIGSGDR